AAARRGSRGGPRSEKESGVAFRMPTSATRSRNSGPERVRRTGGPLERAGLSEPVIESPDRARRPRRPARKARRRDIAGGYGEEEQRRAAGCIGRRAT